MDIAVYGFTILWHFFKGYLCNFKQNFEPINRKICILLILIFVCDLRYIFNCVVNKLAGEMKYLSHLISIWQNDYQCYIPNNGGQATCLKLPKLSDDYLCIMFLYSHRQRLFCRQHHIQTVLQLKRYSCRSFYSIQPSKYVCTSMTDRTEINYREMKPTLSKIIMKTSSNGNIFRITGLLCEEFTVTGEFPSQRPVKRSFEVFFDLRLNKRFSKHSWGWWFETPSRSLWRHCGGVILVICIFQSLGTNLECVIFHIYSRLITCSLFSCHIFVRYVYNCRLIFHFGCST